MLNNGSAGIIQNGDRILLLQVRNLGDAVISTAFINSVGENLPDAELTVLTRPISKAIFQGSPFVKDVLTTKFPTGMGASGLLTVPELMRRLWQLRRLRYDWAVNLVGDFREDAAGWAIAGKRALAPGWMAQHPQTETLLRLPGRSRVKRVAIPPEIATIYDAVHYFSEASTGLSPASPALFKTPDLKYQHVGSGEAIGLHPFATNPSRRWEDAQWRHLLKKLLHDGRKIVVFGSSGQREQLQKIFGELLTSPDVRTAVGGVRDFFDELCRICLLVCLDSFASHAAYAVGAPRLVINGAKPTTLWSPPGSNVLSAGDKCRWYPCYCKPSPPCVRSKARPYLCVRGVTVDEVFRKIKQITC